MNPKLLILPILLLGVFSVIGVIIVGTFPNSQSDNEFEDEPSEYTLLDPELLEKSPDIKFTFDTFPYIDSSTSNQHIVYKTFCALTKYTCLESEFSGEKYISVDYKEREAIGYDKFDAKIRTSKTHGAYINLINKEVDLILVASPPSEEELAEAESKGVKFELTPIAKDAFIFMKHKDNPIDELSTEDIQVIYSGIITEWETLGWDDGGSIKAYTRNPNSGSQETMKDLVMEGFELIEIEEMAIFTMKDLIYQLSFDPSGIGYSFFFYKNAMTQAPNVEFLTVDGIEPNKSTISSEEYPFTTYVYLVMREEENPKKEALQVKEWLLSPEGQNVIEDVGYVSIRKG